MDILYSCYYNCTSACDVALIYPMLEMANAIAAFNLFEKIILENHIRSIQLDSQRIFANRIIGKIDEKLFSDYMNILQRTSKPKEIQVGFQYEQGFSELKKQDEIYKSFRNTLNKLGRKTAYKDIREPFQVTRKETRNVDDYFLKLGKYVEKVDFHLRIGKKKEYAIRMKDEIDEIVYILAPRAKIKPYRINDSVEKILDIINNKFSIIVTE